MSDRQWTENQKAAIDTRDRTLLVSAAAGSGKTATLTERIIRSILDTDDPINIEDMLIVTYTRAAVGELSERIGKAIKKEMRKRPNDSRLERQLHMLPSAKICTIDAFCADILRANAERVGITPAFRIPDTAESQLIAENILDGLLSSVYEGDFPEIATPEQIDMLTDCLAGTRQQGNLPSIIRLIYESTLTALEGVDAIGALIEEYDPAKFSGVEQTGFGKYIMNKLSDMLKHYKRVFREMLSEVTEIANQKFTKIAEMLGDCLELIERLESCDGYESARAVLTGCEFKKAAPVPSNADLPPIAVIRREFKDGIEELRDKFFSQPAEEWRIAYEGLYKQFTVFFRLIKEFDRLFKAEKLRRGICEFSDIERYTYECLWQNGEKTDIALSQASLYKAVYIDEYQDVNSLQNKIFEAISSETNRFMVGDIKQSIYEFRSANPKIFADMKRAYPPLGSGGDRPCASIFMSDNFRCDKGIIDFVNDVFDKVFCHLGDSIGYVEADRLSFSKIYDHDMPEYRYPEICLVNTFPKSDPRSELIDDPNMLVPEVVARKIKELIDTGRLDNGEKIQPKHIAIIMRKVRNKAEKFSSELAKLDIPSALAEDSRFFLSSDVLLVLCLLNSIDNPFKDIYLSGLMCSPIFGFTPGEVALIRKHAPAETLYESLLKYTEEGGDMAERVKAFTERLAYYRMISEGMSADKLMIKLYHETGLLALAAGNTEKKDNLMLLYEHARKFESGSFKGLYNFISYINQLTGRKNDFDKREAPGECDAVRIITAHGSKGLEYPIVFFVGTEASFNQSTDIGEAPRFEYEEDFGIGMFLRTPSGLALVRNSTKEVIKDYRHRKKIEEEARVLYVILTRARERLYVVGNVGTNPSEFIKNVSASREYMSPYSIYNTGSFLKMIASAKDFDFKSPREFLSDPPYVYTEAAESGEMTAEEETAAIAEAPVCELTDSGAFEEELRARFAFKYSDEHLTRLPGKLSVSKLYPAILDGTDAEVTEIVSDDDGTYPVSGKLPKFRSGKDDRESAKRGIATHMLLQFCDIKHLYENGGRKELERLTENGFLSMKDAELVRINEVDKFVRSKLILDMMNAGRIYREFRFNVKLPAEKFAEDPELKRSLAGESVLVQGVIDCLIIDGDGKYHLIDYKTDRLTSEELADRELARRKMYEKHSLQLSYYADAVELMFGRYPDTVEVYSLPLGDTLDVSQRTERVLPSDCKAKD